MGDCRCRHVWNTETYLCVVDYHSKFPVVKQIDGLTTESLIKMCKIIFTEYGFPRRIKSDAGTNFVSKKFKAFYRHLNIHQAISLAYNHQSNGQAEAWVNFIKHTVKKYFDTNNGVHLTLLQIHLTPIGPALTSLAVLIFNKPIRILVPKLGSPPYYLIMMMAIMLLNRKATKH